MFMEFCWSYLAPTLLAIAYSVSNVKIKIIFNLTQLIFVGLVLENGSNQPKTTLKKQPKAADVVMSG
jgi:hypothetical protein